METIFTYTRAQAIEDGLLIDVTDTARPAAFRVPVALTAGAWEDCVAWDASDNARKGTCQDQDGRLWDVIWMASCAARRASNSSERLFTLLRTPRQGRGRAARKVTLKLHIGPGDSGEPVITLMLPDED